MTNPSGEDESVSSNEYDSGEDVDVTQTTTFVPDYKIKLRISGGGSWQQINQKWEYVTDQPSHPVKVKSRFTLSELVAYACYKCDVVNSVGMTTLAYKVNNDDNIYRLENNDHVAGFLEWAGGLNKAPTIYLYDVPYRGNDEQQEGEEEEEEDEENILEENILEEDDEENILEENILEEEDDDEEEEEELDIDSYVFYLGISDSESDEEATTKKKSKKSIAGSNDYFDMPPLLPTPETVITPNLSTPYIRSERVKVGMLFKTKDEMKLALAKKFIDEGFEYKVHKSCKTRFEAKCYVESCQWRMTASNVGSTEMFHVLKVDDMHTCSKTQLHHRHRQATAMVLGNLILPKVKDTGRMLRAKDIVSDVKHQYNINISIWQAYRAKSYAALVVQGDPADSFSRLPKYFYNLELRNPGTVTNIRTDSHGRFDMCFAALGCAIETFVSHLRRVLIIDCAHLKGLYLGTMYLAVAMDANNQIVPVAFGVGRSENGVGWTWFLSMLKQCFGELSDLVFISDRHPAINLGITTVFPTAHHGLCCRHLEMNVKTKDRGIGIKHRKKLYWKTCQAYTTADFDMRMFALRAALPQGCTVLDRLDPEKWTRAHFKGNRYNIMTSNSAESINALCRYARKMPICALFEYFRDFQQEWYSKRRAKEATMINGLTPWAENKIYQRAYKAASWTVHEIGQGCYEVLDYRRNETCNYFGGICTCLKWQKSGLPCGHAIAVATSLGSTDCSNLAWPFYSASNFRATYAPLIYPLGTEETWVVPEQPLMIVRPPLIKKATAGRPSNHDRIPSRGEDPIRKKCTHCGQTGHTKRTCTNRAWANVGSEGASGSRQTQPLSTPDNYGSHAHYTFDLNDDLN